MPDFDFVLTQSDEDQTILIAEMAKLELRREAKAEATRRCRAKKAAAIA